MGQNSLTNFHQISNWAFCKRCIVNLFKRFCIIKQDGRHAHICRLSSVPIFPIFSSFLFFSYILTPFPIFFTKFLYFLKCCRLSALMFSTGPYFQKQLIYDVNSSKNPVTLHYDETTTTQVVKQMDLHFRFWSEEQNEVVRRFYTALMFGHAQGAKVAAVMVDKLEKDKVNLSSILTLSSDGPNVNKTIFRAVNMPLKGAGNPGMINIGTCNLHVVHNSFCKALEAYGTPVDDLAVDIHSFFKISSARREDFKFISARRRSGNPYLLKTCSLSVVDTWFCSRQAY